MIIVYLLEFSRIVLASVFALSAIQKTLAFSTFVDTIHSFDLIPVRGCPAMAIVLLTGEWSVFISLFIGERYMLVGFALAFSLLTVFIMAIFTVFIRSMQIKCNCFINDDHNISTYTLLRDVGLLLVAISGWITWSMGGDRRQGPEIVWLLIVAIAGEFIVLHLRRPKITRP